MISLAGKAALITGGSRGIGAAAVKLFAQAGADVVFNYVKAKDAAIQVQQEAGKHGTRVEAFKADVGKHADNQKLVEHTIARLGRLDILVAPGGGASDMPNAVLESKAGQKTASTVIPLGRAATAEEIAGPILFVASDLANFMTGEVINVNGGAVLCG